MAGCISCLRLLFKNDLTELPVGIFDSLTALEFLYVELGLRALAKRIYLIAANSFYSIL